MNPGLPEYIPIGVKWLFSCIDSDDIPRDTANFVLLFVCRFYATTSLCQPGHGENSVENITHPRADRAMCSRRAAWTHSFFCGTNQVAHEMGFVTLYITVLAQCST
jgi:hypothetical protein